MAFRGSRPVARTAPLTAVSSSQSLSRVQALQLAYHRDQGRFDATYESSMTRLFLHVSTA